MSAEDAKLWSGVLLGTFSFALVCFPLRIHYTIHGSDEKQIQGMLSSKKTRRFGYYMTFLNAFGSGVLLCTCLVHIIPEVHELVGDNIRTKDYTVSCAVAQIFICIGFFIIYFVEEICNWIVTKTPSIPSKLNRDPAILNRSNNVVLSVSGMIAGHTARERSGKKMKLNINQGTDEERNDRNISRREVVAIIISNGGKVLHAFYEGLSIGLQSKNAANVWFLTTAMMIHSATTLFYVGLKLIMAATTKKVIIRHFIFQALASPLGIFIGNLLLKQHYKKSYIWLDIEIQAFSAGTILYITFFEALCKEKKLRVHRICRSVSMIAGFSLMCASEFFVFLEKDDMRMKYYLAFHYDSWNETIKRT